MRTSRRFALLTRRERIVLGHLMDGLSAEGIARLEYVTVCTVRSQIAAILMKLGVNSQLAAVALVHREMWADDLDRMEAFERVVTGVDRIGRPMAPTSREAQIASFSG